MYLHIYIVYERDFCPSFREFFVVPKKGHGLTNLDIYNCLLAQLDCESRKIRFVFLSLVGSYIQSTQKIHFIC